MAVEIMKCILVGLAVGMAWLPLCFVASMFFYSMRDIGMFSLLFLIPAGAIYTWFVTRKYLLQETNRVRGAVSLGARYFFLGAAIGFFLVSYACDVSDVSFITFIGGAIGAIIGSIGGAFQGWLWPRSPVDHTESQNIDVCDQPIPPRPES